MSDPTLIASRVFLYSVLTSVTSGVKPILVTIVDLIWGTVVASLVSLLTFFIATKII